MVSCDGVAVRRDDACLSNLDERGSTDLMITFASQAFLRPKLVRN